MSQKHVNVKTGLELEEALAAATGPRVVQFVPEWCKKSKAIKNALLQDIEELLSDEMIFVSVDVDSVGEDTVMDLGVSSFPYVSCYIHGKRHGKFTGKNSEEAKAFVKEFRSAYTGDGDDPANELPMIDYDSLISKIDAKSKGESDFIANTANVSSFIWHEFIETRGEGCVNWVGFYFVRPLKNSEEHLLVLGPFMGKPACKRIKIGSGVCGAAASSMEIQRIPKVHDFPGHIACDDASKSEIVVPVKNAAGQLVAVLDMDCPNEHGFSAADAHGLNSIAELVGNRCSWGNLLLPVGEFGS